MRLALLMLVGGTGLAAAVASLEAGYSVWAALGVYALVVDLVALSCLAGGALIERASASREAATGRAPSVFTAVLMKQPC